MATAPQINLDGPPPLPPEVAAAQTPQRAGLGALTGPLGAGGQNQGAVIERAMMIEQMLSSLAQMLPEFAPAADQMVQLLRSGVVQAMQGSPSPTPQQNMMGTGMGMIG